MYLQSTIPFANPGWATKVGIGIEPSGVPGQAVIAARLLPFTKLDPGNGGAKRTPRETITGFPGYTNTNKGEAEYMLKLTSDATPEGSSELLSLYCGAPVTSVVAVVATPSAPTVTNVGAAGAATNTYKIVASSPQGDSALSTLTANATSNATLNGTNYNKITWPAVPGATSYKVLKLVTATYELLGETQWLSFNDQGQTPITYTAPGGPTGNLQLWNTNTGYLTGTISAFYGENYDTSDLIAIWAGCRGDKLNAKWSKKGGKALEFDCDLRALYNTWGFSAPSSVGLDVATLDALNAYNEAYAVAMIAGETCTINEFGAAIDRGLSDKHELNGFGGATTMVQGRNKNSFDITASFDSDKNLRRFMAATAASGTFSEQLGLPTYPVQVVVANPINGGGIVNQFSVYSAVCTYETIGMPIEGANEIMQKIKIQPYIDFGSTGTDMQIGMVNSQTNGAIITPETLITGFNAGAINSYSN